LRSRACSPERREGPASGQTEAGLYLHHDSERAALGLAAFNYLKPSSPIGRGRDWLDGQRGQRRVDQRDWLKKRGYRRISANAPVALRESPSALPRPGAPLWPLSNASSSLEYCSRRAPLVETTRNQQRPFHGLAIENARATSAKPPRVRLRTCRRAPLSRPSP
jgi:hypothetical protein